MPSVVAGPVVDFKSSNSIEPTEAHQRSLRTQHETGFISSTSYFLLKEVHIVPVAHNLYLYLRYIIITVVWGLEWTVNEELVASLVLSV